MKPDRKGNTPHNSALSLARETVASAKPGSREYIVARAFLDLDDHYSRLRWVGEDELRNLRRCCSDKDTGVNYGHYSGGFFF